MSTIFSQCRSPHGYCPSFGHPCQVPFTIVLRLQSSYIRTTVVNCKGNGYCMEMADTATHNDQSEPMNPNTRRLLAPGTNRSCSGNVLVHESLIDVICNDIMKRMILLHQSCYHCKLGLAMYDQITGYCYMYIQGRIQGGER